MLGFALAKAHRAANRMVVEVELLIDTRTQTLFRKTVVADSLRVVARVILRAF